VTLVIAAEVGGRWRPPHTIAKSFVFNKFYFVSNFLTTTWQSAGSSAIIVTIGTASHFHPSEQTLRELTQGSGKRLR
jgi:hypothetical protein